MLAERPPRKVLSSPVTFTPFGSQDNHSLRERTALVFRLLETDILAIRDTPVTVVRIVVVQFTRSINVANVVSVGGVRSSHPPITGIIAITLPLFIRFHP